jgi:hypothetical protein
MYAAVPSIDSPEPWLALAAGQRKPEVAELEVARRRDPHVLGLDVTMDDPACMHVLQRGRHLGRDPQHVSQCDRVDGGIGDPGGKVAAAGVLGDEVRPAIGVFAAVIEGDCVGVTAHARDGIELAPHPQLADVVERLGLDQCEPHLATGMTVGRQIHALVSAPSDQPFELIPPASDRARQPPLLLCARLD